MFFDNQLGFRAKHSTDHAILSIVDKIQRAIDERDFSCGIFLDFSKVFDIINHKILFKNFELYGIRGIANQWFSSYLSNRLQTVTVNGITSNSVNISCGVPQASVLGPILFLLYSYFEKGCREKAKKCTRQSREVIWDMINEF